jgi:hypothetical protein
MANGPQDRPEIEVVHLGRDQEPVDENGWILVENAVSGPVIRKAVGEGRAAAAVVQGPFATRQDAFESAKRQAQELGMSVIYAKDFPNA